MLRMHPGRPTVQDGPPHQRRPRQHLGRRRHWNPAGRGPPEGPRQGPAPPRQGPPRPGRAGGSAAGGTPFAGGAGGVALGPGHPLRGPWDSESGPQCANASARPAATHRRPRCGRANARGSARPPMSSRHCRNSGPRATRASESDSLARPGPEPTVTRRLVAGPRVTVEGLEPVHVDRRAAAAPHQASSRWTARRPGPAGPWPVTT
jgi:hypothetical protein